MSDDDIRERLTRLEAAVTRSLDLLCAGLPEEAQRELAHVAAPTSTSRHESGGISELELEEAFESARPEIDQMRDADQVAHEAMLASGGHEPELVVDTTPTEPSAAPTLPPSFATATMAELLERQGDAEGASRIRAGLAAAAPALTPAAAARPSRSQVIDTLELWLGNMRRARA